MEFGAWFAERARRLSARLVREAPREFFLVAACCRAPAADETRAAAIRAAAAAGVDWEALLRIATRHQVTGFVRQGLLEAGLAPPPPIAARLSALVRQLAGRNLLQAAETARLSRLLNEAGVAAVFVKGATLQALAYRDMTLKSSYDIDVLVTPNQTVKARGVLESAGYRADPPLPPAGAPLFDRLVEIGREWVFCREKLTVELQWRLADNPHILRGVGVNSPLQLVHLRGGTAPTLRNAELLVYLCVHGAQHSWSQLKWLADVDWLLARTGVGAEELHEAAREAGADRCLAQGLLLRERLFGRVLPAPLGLRLRASARVAMLEAAALNSLLGGKAETPYKRRSYRFLRSSAPLLLRGEGWGFLVEECRRHLILPIDVATLPLPRGCVWLYAALRAPLWVSRRLRG